MLCTYIPIDVFFVKFPDPATKLPAIPFFVAAHLFCGQLMQISWATGEKVRVHNMSLSSVGALLMLLFFAALNAEKGKRKC